MIPKVIHYCWFGRNSKPKLAEKCIKSWKKYCPDYQIIEWNEDNFDINSNVFVKEAYEAKKWAFVTDYVRLWAIYTMGGVYMDTDVEVVRNIDEFLKHEAYSGFESLSYVPTGIMAGVKANPVYADFLRYYNGRHFIQADGSFDTETNTKIITGIMKEKGLRCDNTYQVIDGFAFYPSDYFCPLDSGTGLINKTKNTATIHHFTGSWCPSESIEKRNAWWRQQRREHIRYAPNRFIRKVVGDDKVNKLKAFLGKM